MFATTQRPLLLSILLVDAGGAGRLSATLRHLRDLRLAMPLEVIAVVGGSDARCRAELQREFPLVKVLEVSPSTDRGAMLSLGAGSVQGRYALLLDGTAQPDAQAIEGMMQFLDKSQWVGVVGPRLVDPAGAETPSSRAFPSARAVLATVMGRAVAQEPAPRLQYAFNRHVTTPKEVDAITTGCCMIRKKALQEVGAWETGYAPGGEALDWCRRAKLRGWSAFYHPGVVAASHPVATAEPAAIASELATALRHMGRYGAFGTVTALKLALALVSMRMVLVEGAASLLPGTHRPGARFGFWRAWHALGAVVNPRRAAA